MTDFRKIWPERSLTLTKEQNCVGEFFHFKYFSRFGNSWIACDTKATMLIGKNKSLSLLELNFFIMQILRKHYVCRCQQKSFITSFEIRFNEYTEVHKNLFFLTELIMWRGGIPGEQGWGTGLAKWGSIPALGVISGLSLLVLHSATRGFSPGTPVFPSPQQPTFVLIWSLFELQSHHVN